MESRCPVFHKVSGMSTFFSHFVPNRATLVHPGATGSPGGHLALPRWSQLRMSPKSVNRAGDIRLLLTNLLRIGCSLALQNVCPWQLMSDDHLLTFHSSMQGRSKLRLFCKIRPGEGVPCSGFKAILPSTSLLIPGGKKNVGYPTEDSELSRILVKKSYDVSQIVSSEAGNKAFVELGHGEAVRWWRGVLKTKVSTMGQFLVHTARFFYLKLRAKNCQMT